MPRSLKKGPFVDGHLAKKASDKYIVRRRKTNKKR